MRLRQSLYHVVCPESSPELLVIRDCSEDSFDPVASVTNDAERVVRQLVAGGLLPPGRRLAYYDSDVGLDEILVKDGQFAGFTLLKQGAKP